MCTQNPHHKFLLPRRRASRLTGSLAHRARKKCKCTLICLCGEIFHNFLREYTLIIYCCLIYFVNIHFLTERILSGKISNLTQIYIRNYIWMHNQTHSIRQRIKKEIKMRIHNIWFRRDTSSWAWKNPNIWSNIRACVFHLCFFI